MTVPRDLFSHKKWPWYKIDARNGKSVMKLVRLSILRPLTFKCVNLERFKSLKYVRELCAKLAIQQLFSI